MPALAAADKISRARKTAQVVCYGGRAKFAFGGATEGIGAGLDAYGLIQSSIPGRTDRHNADLPAGSYVLPADVVSGLGEGNSLAGATIIDKMLNANADKFGGPNGSKALPVKKGSGISIPKNPSPYQSADGSYEMHNLVSNIPSVGDMGEMGGKVSTTERSNGYAHAGPVQGEGKVPCVLAGGEFVLPPSIIARHPLLGGLGNDNTNPEHYKQALSNGHRVLDSWVLHERAKHIKTLQKLPGPKK